MANPAENKISEALAAYDFVGEVVGTVRFGKGHINDTFCVYTQTEEGDCVPASRPADAEHCRHNGLSARRH